ncbi:MAG: hypothetical protein AAFU66_04665 [Pseudomonadota bacterium]
MTSKIDATYIELRERILFGELPAGSPLSESDIVAHTGVTLPMARQLRLALAVGGYLTRTGRSYVVATFTKEQVEEWRLALGAIVEIGALRLALVGGSKLDAVAEFLETNLRSHDVEEEAFFIGAITFTTVILGGRGSTLSELVEQSIPQAFFRLLWLSDAYAERTGFLVEACDHYLNAARAGDLEGVRAACRSFFDSVAPALHTLIERMEAGDYPTNDKQDGFQSIEPQISGMATYTGSARATKLLFSPLADADLTTRWD